MINQASSHLYECVGASKILLKQNLPFLLEYEPLSLCCQQWCLAFCPRPNPKHRAADIRDGYYAPHRGAIVKAAVCPTVCLSVACRWFKKGEL